MNFISILLGWYKNFGRDLPWRKDTNPYKIWISEIIFQQTRIKQGTDYYIRWMNSFPTIKAVALADEQEILNHWKGLGYYSRALYIHQTAKIINEKYNGIFPFSYEEILRLKGIGKYTAAAICSISFHQIIPAIDGNAFRFFSRLLGIEDDISKSKTYSVFFKKIQEIMNNELKDNNPGDFNQAVMDFGSLLCVPLNPKCSLCPFTDLCIAFKENNQAFFPVNNKKTARKSEKLHYYYIHHREKLILVKRNKTGIWKSLYEFPQNKRLKNEGNLENIKNLSLSSATINQLKNNLSEKFQNFKIINSYKVFHLLTHKKLEIQIDEIEVSNDLLLEYSKFFEGIIISNKKTDLYPFPKPIENYINSHIKQLKSTN